MFGVIFFTVVWTNENCQNHPNDIQIRQCDTVATAEEHSLLDVLNDSVSPSFIRA